MTTPPIVTITDELLAEIEAAADAFPDYEWDSNQTEFFNGPSGESLGGEPTGFYCVYGPPFEVEDETYDGPTLVEACPLNQAKFICEAKPAIKALLAHIADLKQQLVAASITAENCDVFRKDAERLDWMESAYGGHTGHDGGFHLSAYMPKDAETLRGMIDAAMEPAQ